eukprot:CAMPEP_0183754680 /NCGR_PEP_ID=MMETSP0739-20130205/3666_1 /TAXON_ID=385413 /ORGANISM="Thalassiosira miniscula, Strain CCMP1093" /LENGTH=59 /DNA_ID=CAMNT_0025991319 /DNA_START=1118 /DNA_END=1297 /DNA_ORIENTATION=+
MAEPIHFYMGYLYHKSYLISRAKSRAEMMPGKKPNDYQNDAEILPIITPSSPGIVTLEQ